MNCTPFHLSWEHVRFSYHSISTMVFSLFIFMTSLSDRDLGDLHKVTQEAVLELGIKLKSLNSELSFHSAFRIITLYVSIFYWEYSLLGTSRHLSPPHPSLRQPTEQTCVLFTPDPIYIALRNPGRFDRSCHGLFECLHVSIFYWEHLLLGN